MRVVALLATYNERRFVGKCIYEWQPLLERKEQLACELEADWFIHLDADELHLPPHGVATLAEALADIDRQGYTAVNFLEFAFLPIVEEPDHDHPDFERTLRTYHPFMPGQIPNRVNAWRAAAGQRPQLAWSGGHLVLFDGMRVYPDYSPMKHYLFLSVPHAIEKYAERRCASTCRAGRSTGAPPAAPTTSRSRWSPAPRSESPRQRAGGDEELTSTTRRLAESNGTPWNHYLRSGLVFSPQPPIAKLLAN